MTAHKLEKIVAKSELSRGHFQFARGVLSGLDPIAMWRRYLPAMGRADEDRARAVMKQLQRRYRFEAMAAGMPRKARLLTLNLAMPVSDTSTPVISESEDDAFQRFAEEFGDFYSESELPARFTEYRASQVGTTKQDMKRIRRAQRRAKLLKEQLDTLDWMASRLAVDPKPSDAVGMWVESGTGRQLLQAGVITVADLVERINGLGPGWHRGIKGLGQMGAQRLLEWVRSFPPDPRLKLLATAEVSRLVVQQGEHAGRIGARVTGVVPLERFVVPSQLSGEQGQFRAPRDQCLIGATNDLSAINTWLATKRSPATVRAYRKEAERLVLWSILVAGKPLSSLNVEDCTAYRNFLANPTPQDLWCGTRARPRWSVLWRPFEGPLTPASERQALIILKSLYAFLVDQRYLVGNPWKGVPPRMETAPQIKTNRSLTKNQWAFVREWVQSLPATEKNLRTKTVLALLFATGLRLDELVKVRIGDLHLVDLDGEPIGQGGTSALAKPADEMSDDMGWMLNVTGKRKKVREVPVPPSVMTLLQAYFQTRGLSADPNDSRIDEAHLIGKLPGTADDEERIEKRKGDSGRVAALRRARGTVDPREGVVASVIYNDLTQLFKAAADALRPKDARAADRLSLASPHWMRHTHGSHAAAAGMRLEDIRDNLGHSSVATTSIYVTTERSRRYREIRRLAG